MIRTLAQLGGSFVAPLLAGAGLLAVTIPVAIHLLSRLRRKRESWGAMRFLRLAYQKQRTKVRMEQWLLLLTRCVLMVLIGLALAGPMLGGSWSRWFSGSGSGRLIVVVIDDSITSQTVGSASDSSWWNGVSSRAVELIQSAGADDRVAVWAAGRPARELVAPGPSDVAIQAIEAMRPTDASADWSGLQRGVCALLDRESSLTGIVFVLSPFARGDGGLSVPSDQAAPWPDDVTVFVDEPAESLENVQIASAAAAREVVLTQASPRTGPDGEWSLSVKVRRFGGASEPMSVGLSARLIGVKDAQVLGSAQRQVSLSAGQLETTAQLSIPLAPTAQSRQGGAWVVTQLMQPGGALSADDALLGYVQLQPTVRVGLWDPMDQGSSADGSGGLSSEAFVRSALSPMGQGVVDLVALREADRGDPAGPWATLDAVVVFGADRLNETMLNSAQAWAQRGGWLVLLPGDVSAGTELDASWLSRVARLWQLDWQPTDGRMDPSDDTGEPLSDQTPTPEALRGLSSDWRALLGPVLVNRRWGLRVPMAQSWLTLANGESLLASAEVGNGRVVLFTSAADTDWTNLPAKPIFPALLQELARAAAAGRPLTRWTAGDVPTLNSDQATTVRLSPVITPSGQAIESPSATSPLEMTRSATRVPGNQDPQQVNPATAEGGALLSTNSPVRHAAGFATQDDASGNGVGPVIVNAEAQAGDTTTWSSSELAAAWDARAARWSWLPEQIGQALRVDTTRVQLGRFLLWALLVLLVLETVMSRWFSHAESSAPSLGRRARQWLDHLRHHPAPGR